MRSFKPNTPTKGKETNNPQMARLFVLTPITPNKTTTPQRPQLPLQNRYTALAEYPKLPAPIPVPSAKLTNLQPTKPFEKGSTSNSSIQTKESYTMKVPETFAEVVNPSAKKPQNDLPKEEKFEYVTIQVLPLLALDKEYEGLRIEDLIKPCFTDFNFMDTKNPYITRRYYESILIDTDSIEVEHSLNDKNPEYINYSRVTIKKILSPFEWFVDHLHTPIALSMMHRPQTYNWHDYKAAWFNFLYLRPGHT